MEIALIVAVMGLSLVPAGIARALRVRTAGFVAALVVAFAWLGASGFYFTVFLQLGNRSAAWVGWLGVLLGAGIVGIVSSGGRGFPTRAPRAAYRSQTQSPQA